MFVPCLACAIRSAPGPVRQVSSSPTCVPCLQEEASGIEIEEEEDVVAVLDLLLQADACRSRLQAIYSHPANALPFLQPGRLVCIPQPPAGENDIICSII